MAGRTYSGGWRRRAEELQAPPPFHSDRDPEHLHPTAEPEPGPVPWVSTAPGLGLPDDVLGADPGLPMPGGIGPVYDPQDGTSVGTLPGVSLAEAQAIRGIAHGTDDGSYAASSWAHTFDRDGAPHLDRIDLTMTPDGDSPQTVDLQRYGAGSPNDPGARRGHRLQRWYDRKIDMHRWTDEYPPKSVRNVSVAQPQPAPAVPTHRDSPFPSIVTGLGIVAPPDRFVEPQMRRSPRPWQESATTDGTPAVATSAPSDYGLTSWGV